MNPDWKKLEAIDWNFAGERTNSLTHGLHPYPAKFIPQIPHQLIKELSEPGETVADIFCGSGTTLVEAMVLNRNAIGVDASPIACLISEGKTTRFNEKDEELLNSIINQAEHLSESIFLNTESSLFKGKSFKSSAYRPEDKAISFWFEPFVVEELAEVLSWCQKLPTESSRKVALTAFSSIVVAVSKQDSDTRYVRRQKKLFPGDSVKRFAKALKNAISSVKEFSKLVDTNVMRQVYQANLLTKPDIGNVDLVVCSPPYPNAYSYHLYHNTRMLWLGMNQPKFKKEEIGSHRKYSSKSSKAPTIETFRWEMATIFDWLKNHLKPNRYACFVVGSSVVRGENIDNTDLISKVAREYGFLEVSRIFRQMQDSKKSFNPGIGRIKTEDILVFKNENSQSFRSAIKCKIKPYIQPFERQLALAELAAVTASKPTLLPSLDLETTDFEVVCDVPAEIVAKKLSYWEEIADKNKSYISAQVMREATVKSDRSITLEQIDKSFDVLTPLNLPKRRCLRYGTHGLHEYRGKFFPQLVSALINIAKVPEGGIVADPTIGSGTTAVEAILAGCYGIGIDLNPLSVLMSRTKCSLLFSEPEKLLKSYDKFNQKIAKLNSTKVAKILPYFSELPSENQKYLERWFAKDIIAELDKIATTIQTSESGQFQDLMWLSLSNIIRKVSWQKEEDLRVRKEIIDSANINPIQEFLNELERSLKTILPFLALNRETNLGNFYIEEGDARNLTTIWQNFLGKADVVITSPPYATALPYLDTDRLSLCYLNLLSRSQHRKRELVAIGNREITEKKRLSYWEYFQKEKEFLPTSVVELIEKIDKLNSNSQAGFRRRNLAALLAKYFFDMREVFVGMAQLLKPGALAFVVIGNNHTTAGGERVEIETAKLLADVAKTVGFELEEIIDMEMLVSRDVFKKNSVASEVILFLRNLS